jgi:hypothetical protein
MSALRDNPEELCSRRVLFGSCLHKYCDQYIRLGADAAFKGSKAFVDRNQFNNSRPRIHKVLARRSNLGKRIENNIIWRAADLLGVSSPQRVGLRQLVLADNAALARVGVGRPCKAPSAFVEEAASPIDSAI